MGIKPRQSQPTNGIPPPFSPSCNAIHSFHNGTYLSSDYMNYNDVSLSCNTNSHMPCHDSPFPNPNGDVVQYPSFDVNIILDCIKSTIESINSSVDSCYAPPPLDTPKPTFGDCTPQLVEEYNEIIDKWTEELMGLDYGGKAYLESIDDINGLVKKRDLRISRTYLGCENESCEAMRVEKEKDHEKCVDESKPWNDFDGGSSYVENENVLREEDVLSDDGFWSSNEDEPYLGLVSLIHEEKEVDFEEICESLDSLSASPHPSTPLFKLSLSHLNQSMAMVP